MLHLLQSPSSLPQSSLVKGNTNTPTQDLYCNSNTNKTIPADTSMIYEFPFTLEQKMMKGQRQKHDCYPSCVL